jgi:hypothetical protein
MNDYSVYMHIFPNKKKYIGITSQKPNNRWNNGRGYIKCPLMYNAVQKYKWHNIEHKILYTNLSKEEAEKLEIELIKEFKTNKRRYGYNIDNGGNSIGHLSKEHKEKISEAHIGIGHSKEIREKLSIMASKRVGKKNPFYGKHHTTETKALLKQKTRNKDTTV